MPTNFNTPTHACTHTQAYWEARYVHELEEGESSKDKAGKGKKQAKSTGTKRKLNNDMSALAKEAADDDVTNEW
jgi:hypothetical protein